MPFFLIHLTFLRHSFIVSLNLETVSEIYVHTSCALLYAGVKEVQKVISSLRRKVTQREKQKKCFHNESFRGDGIK